MAYRFLAFIIFLLFICSLIDLLITLFKFKRDYIRDICEEVFIDLCVDRSLSGKDNIKNKKGKK